MVATPWAVLCCKFKDDGRGFVTINLANSQAMFTGNHADNVQAFWQDVSYGALDLSGSQAFGWLTLDKNQADYVGSGANSQGRRDLVTWARDAAAKAKIDLSGYYGTVVFMSTATDLWGSPNTVVCDASSSMAAILQEYGHGFGLAKHSRAVSTPNADYSDPVCAMSAMTFGGTNPTFAGAYGQSGPLIASPYVDAGGWLTSSRIRVVPVVEAKPKLTTLKLAPLGERTPADPQVARFDLTTPYQAAYYVEYRSGGWDRGLAQPLVVLHQRRPDGYAYYAGGVPAITGTVWRDPDFNLSLRIGAISAQNIEITIGSRAAVDPLSVRAVAATQLNLRGPIAIRSQILRPGETSVKRGLLVLLDQ